MAAVYQIEGLHCGNCAANVQKALQAKGVAATVTVEPPRVRIDGAGSVSREVIAATIAAAGDYKLGAEVEESAPATGFFSKIRQVFNGT